ncbi:hypothetical protein FJTKL_09579 [Diaporthe vaccinii]|uniref:Uncharacterized protein n=1 Tax=Diaporthe vaccinii TaxID=105482 RepID=A0ABR4EMX0_9PEZI
MPCLPSTRPLAIFLPSWSRYTFTPPTPVHPAPSGPEAELSHKIANRPDQPKLYQLCPARGQQGCGISKLLTCHKY